MAKPKKLTRESIIRWLESDLDLEQFAEQLGLKNKYSITNFCSSLNIKIPKKKWNKKQGINHFAIKRNRTIGICEFWNKNNNKFKVSVYSSNPNTKKIVEYVFKQNNIKYRVRKQKRKTHQHWEIEISNTKSIKLSLILLLQDYVKLSEVMPNSSQD